MPEAVFVSPHPDDVALSCGGSVALLARTATPVIVTVFAGEPRDEISSFAQFQHERWGLESREVAAHRRSEDTCAARCLGSSVQLRWLDYLDAIYRDPAYASDDALFGQMLDSDLDLIDAITSDLVEMDAGEYFVPLAVGDHVDHQLAFRAGRRLAAGGANVWAYADVPYVIDPNMKRLTECLARGTVGEVRVTELDPDALDRRWQAIACYQSQLPIIFRHLGDPRTAVERYARYVGGGQPAEIFWRVVPTRR